MFWFILILANHALAFPIYNGAAWTPALALAGAQSLSQALGGGGSAGAQSQAQALGGGGLAGAQSQAQALGGVGSAGYPTDDDLCHGRGCFHDHGHGQGHHGHGHHGHDHHGHGHHGHGHHGHGHHGHGHHGHGHHEYGHHGQYHDQELDGYGYEEDQPDFEHEDPISDLIDIDEW